MTLDLSKARVVEDILEDCLKHADGHEINMNNYGYDEVDAINNAYVQLICSIKEALKAIK